MDDRKIIELFFKRDEDALRRTQVKYGKYCESIARNILGNEQDSEEVLNDTLLSAWNSIPPEDPKSLRLYLAALARNHALDRYRKEKAAKRRDAEYTLCLDEVAEFIEDAQSFSEEYERREFTELLNRFLRSLPLRERDIFVRRYFFCDKTPDIAARFSLKEPNVLKILSRTREKLKTELKKGGYII